MARKALVIKQSRKPKFKTRAYTRCLKCGRARGVFREYLACRLCFRTLAYDGYVPGVKKSS